MTPSEILEQAGRLVSEDRRREYGDYGMEAANVAAGWSVILGLTVEPRLVPLCMVWLKTVREAYQHKEDNLVDGAGYFALTRKALEGAAVRTVTVTGTGTTVPSEAP